MHKSEWYQWFPGHYILSNTFSMCVSVDARGINELKPIAIIEYAKGEGYQNVFYQPCNNLGEAQKAASTKYAELLKEALEAVEEETS